MPANGLDRGFGFTGNSSILHHGVPNSPLLPTSFTMGCVQSARCPSKTQLCTLGTSLFVQNIYSLLGQTSTINPFRRIPDIGTMAQPRGTHHVCCNTPGILQKYRLVRLKPVRPVRQVLCFIKHGLFQLPIHISEIVD